MTAALRILTGLAGALRLLTVVPIPGKWDREDARGLTVACFPLVGLGLGVALAACALLPIPAAARAALVLLLWTGLTGGLHEDGWADTADAVFAPAVPEERARILKDPRVGALGVTATALLLLLRYGALTVVPAAAVLTAPVIGRWAMATSLTLAPPLSADGLGARYGRDATGGGATAAAVAALLPVALTSGAAVRSVLAVAAAACVGWAVARFVVGRIGGLNGDGHGAVGLAAETAALWAHVPLTAGAAPWL